MIFIPYLCLCSEIFNIYELVLVSSIWMTPFFFVILHSLHCYLAVVTWKKGFVYNIYSKCSKWSMAKNSYSGLRHSTQGFIQFSIEASSFFYSYDYISISFSSSMMMFSSKSNNFSMLSRTYPFSTGTVPSPLSASICSFFIWISYNNWLARFMLHWSLLMLFETMSSFSWYSLSKESWMLSSSRISSSKWPSSPNLSSIFLKSSW